MRAIFETIQVTGRKKAHKKKWRNNESRRIRTPRPHFPGEEQLQPKEKDIISANITFKQI
jgi:hypothetical protein